jgi:hypothetical protein
MVTKLDKVAEKLLMDNADEILQYLDEQRPDAVKLEEFVEQKWSRMVGVNVDFSREAVRVVTRKIIQHFLKKEEVC